MTFEESHTIPSQQNVILVQKLRFGLVNRSDEDAGADSSPSKCRIVTGNALNETNRPTLSRSPANETNRPTLSSSPTRKAKHPIPDPYETNHPVLVSLPPRATRALL